MSEALRESIAEVRGKKHIVSGITSYDRKIYSIYMFICQRQAEEQYKWLRFGKKLD